MERFRHSLLLAAMLSLFSNSNLFSQSLLSVLPDDPLATKLQLTFVNGTGIACLSPLDSSSFLRFALDITLNTSDNTTDFSNSSYYAYPDTTVRYNSTVAREADNRHMFARISLLYSGTLASSQASLLYAGLGPFIAYDRAYGSLRLDRDSDLHSSSSSYAWTFGAMGIIGLRTQVVQNLAVHIEYAVAYSHSNDHRSESRYGVGPVSTDGSAESSEGTTNSFSFGNFTAGITFTL